MKYQNSFRFSHSARERFLRYAVIDTQSDPHSTTVPSTAKQKNLAQLLVSELKELGATEVELDEFGYVFATIESNSPKKVPTLAFCSHMDTSPDCSGTGVRPMVHENYRGQTLVLPDDARIKLGPKSFPALKEKIGHDIITASGATLLGADNKAGVAAIMDAMHLLKKHPEIKHGKIRVIFTPDEEIGRGVNHLDMKKLGADFGYTIDGEEAGSIEDETFSADGAVITIEGISAHPGFAKDKLVNALRVSGYILSKLPMRQSPERTSGRQGFIHPYECSGGAERAQISLILRDFDNKKLRALGVQLKEIVQEAKQRFAGCKISLEIKEQYRNMNSILKRHPHVMEHALEALKRAGFPRPLRRAIRGGTDGSRLSFMGLPCPNIFAGEHAFHSKYEWVSVQDMQKAAETIIHLTQVWEERSTL